MIDLHAPHGRRQMDAWRHGSDVTAVLMLRSAHLSMTRGVAKRSRISPFRATLDEARRRPPCLKGGIAVGTVLRGCDPGQGITGEKVMHDTTR